MLANTNATSDFAELVLFKRTVSPDQRICHPGLLRIQCYQSPQVRSWWTEMCQKLLRGRNFESYSKTNARVAGALLTEENKACALG